MPTIPDSHLALLDAPFATLATIDPDGRPQLTQVAFLAEDGVVRISLNDSRHKTGNLRRDPSASVLVLDPATPMRYLELRGEVEIAPDADLHSSPASGPSTGWTSPPTIARASRA